MLTKPLEAVFHIRRPRSAPLGDYKVGPIPYLSNSFGSAAGTSLVVLEPKARMSHTDLAFYGHVPSSGVRVRHRVDVV